MNRLEQAARRKGGPLLTVSVQRHNPMYVEMVARIGYDVLWIEMEHVTVTFAEATDMCALAQAMGMLVLIRVPNASRDNVLRAAECGPDVIDVPMVNSPEPARELVRHARFGPQGERGHYGSSRAFRYALFDSLVAEHERVNDEICLMAQIETLEAVEAAEDIAQVPGLDALFVGRGDLSSSLGVPGNLTHPKVEEMTDRTLAVAARYGKLTGVPGKTSEYLLWRDKGVTLLLCGSDVAALKTGLQAMMDDYLKALS